MIIIVVIMVYSYNSYDNSYQRYNCFFIVIYDMMNSHLIAGSHGNDVGELATFPSGLRTPMSQTMPSPFRRLD